MVWGQHTKYVAHPTLHFFSHNLVCAYVKSRQLTYERKWYGGPYSLCLLILNQPHAYTFVDRCAGYVLPRALRSKQDISNSKEGSSYNKVGIHIT